MKIVGYRLREAIKNAGYKSISNFSSECGFSRPFGADPGSCEKGVASISSL